MTMAAAPLVLISVDGLCASALDAAAWPLPALQALAARGVRLDGLVPTFPSVTWPCHTTLVTGVSPAQHGILGNHVFDRRDRRVISHLGDRSGRRPRVETLYEAAAAAGLTTASLCWPQTRGATCLGDHIPECYEQTLFERYASRPLWDELREAGLPVDRYAEWSSEYAHAPLQDWLTLEAARLLVRRRAPDVLLVHFLVVDSFQHLHGVDSAESRWALRYVDGLIARLLADLDEAGRLDRTNVVVLGDHGFVPVERMALPNAELYADGLLSLDGGGEIVDHLVRVVGNGGSANVYVEPGPARAAMIERMRERFTFAPGVGMVLGEDAFPALGLPSPAEDPTQGDLILVAADGWYFADHATLEAAAAAKTYRGMHGHLPDDPRLRAGFLAAGPGIAEGLVLGVHDHLDVAPTLATLLDVKLGGAERSAIEALLAR